MVEFVPTPEQEAALGAPTPLLILAGAGTGKTTVLTHRIANLIAEGKARPEELLALTFAEKAATEMSERLASLLSQRGLGDAGREVHCSTFHSFGAEIIRDNATLLGREADCRVLSTPESWQLLSRIVDQMEFDSVELPMNGLGTILSGMLGFFSQASDQMVTPERLSAFVESQDLSGASEMVAEKWGKRLAQLREVAECYRRYRDAKLERGYLDYGDLLTLPVQIFREYPEVRDSYRDRFPHLFVDEYQDTNYAQKLLLMELLSAEARIVVIGDDDQSIYGWRGAAIENILGFMQEPAIRGASPTRTELTESRRSGPELLALANRIIDELPDGRRYRKALKPQNSAPPATVGHYLAATASSEAAWIARTIEDLQPDTTDPTGKKRGHGNFAVLCRKRSLFPAIAAALDAAGLPYELVGGSGFYGRWEIRDVLSYLRVLSDPTDNLALARVLQSRPWRICDRDLFHLSRWAQTEQSAISRRRSSNSPRKLDTNRDQRFGEDASAHGPQNVALGATSVSPNPGVRYASPLRESAVSAPISAPSTPHSAPDPEGDAEEPRFRLYDAVAAHHEVAGLSPEAPELLGRLQRLLDGLARSVGLVPLAEQVERTIDGAGYRRELSAQGDFDSRLALLNLGKLVELARQFQGAEGTLEGFVEYVQYALESGGEEAEVRPVDEGSDSVKVMTIHQAKGLEFPVVFIPGLGERILPDPRVDDPDRWDQFPGQLRGDRLGRETRDFRDIPVDKASMAARKDAIRERELEEERRLFYVALTRAQRALFLSRAWWYFSNAKARNASLFWDEVVGAEIDGVPISKSLGEEEAPAENPRLQGGAAWSGRGAGVEKSQARLLLAADRGESWIQRVADEDPEEWRRRKASVDRQLALVSADRTVAPVLLSAETSCTGLLQYDECPRLFRYLHVDRLPERPSPWAALGTEMHRRIEEMARSGAEDAPGEEDWELKPEGVERPDGGQGEAGTPDLLRVYSRSRFGRRPATKIEEAFTLPLGPNLLRGRIDRLDRLPDGSWEIVDFKSGRFPGQVDRRYRLQLQVYSLAAWRLWGIEPELMSSHLFFLASDHDEALCFKAEELKETEAWAMKGLEQIRQEVFPRTDNPEPCVYCGYAHLCAAD